MVDEVGLTAAAPTPIAAPPPQARAPEAAPEIKPAPPQPESAPTPVVVPSPQPRIVSPAPPKAVAPPRPTPAPAKPAPTKPALAKAAPTKAGPARARAPQIGDDFLKGIADSPARTSSATAKPAAPVYSAQAQKSINQSILSQAKRCALRQPFLGDGANRVSIRVNLHFARDGRLIRPPAVLSRSGDPDLIAKYSDLLEDDVRRIFADCAPFRLPPDLYDTPSGGWKDFPFIYKKE